MALCTTFFIVRSHCGGVMVKDWMLNFRGASPTVYFWFSVKPLKVIEGFKHGSWISRVKGADTIAGIVG